MTQPIKRRRRSVRTDEAIAVLERRILGGDYLVTPLPTVRELAAELGVSYVTARKALVGLQDRGLLERTETGRPMLAKRGDGTGTAQVAFLAPAWPSQDVMRWRLALDQVAAESDCAVKCHFYMHWDDPVLLDSLERGDGAFLYPSSELLTPPVERRLSEKNSRVVVVDQDWSERGMPSLCATPAQAVSSLLDHGRSRGFKHWMCINTQAHDQAINARIHHYRHWCDANGQKSEIMDRPVVSGEDAGPVALAVMRDYFAHSLAPQVGIFATTLSASIGAMRAAHEAGHHVGTDVGVMTLNDDGLGDMLIPSLTALQTPDILPWMRESLRWILNHDRAWQGSLLKQPKPFVVVERESTLGA
jgi:hypothetical protein